MATSFTINKADLEFILRQIKIAEASSVAYDATPLTIIQAIQAEYGLTAANAAMSPFGLRTTDGSMNNTLPGQNFFGGADNTFPRLTDPVFRNEGDETPFVGVTNTNYGNTGNVVDRDPRIISNLIVDMSITNPAAIEAYLHNPLSLAQFEADHPGLTPVAPSDIDTPAKLAAWTTAHPGETPLALTTADLQTIPNQSPDVGLTAGFNSWMTFFGQFFDHGLDFVVKGGNGSVLVPLMPDDPLITLGPDGVAGTGDEVTNPALQFMALTRAKTANGVVDGQTLNTTTSFVDQNQTYTSHSSHQVFLREYVKDTNGHAVSTGRLIDGGHDPLLGNKLGAIGNWAEVKAQAKEMLGLTLTDHDVLNVPLLLTDQYGKFIPGANGYAQVVTAVDADGKPTAWVEGTAAGLSLPLTTVRTGHAFLDDLAHHAAPGFVDANHNGIMDPGEMLQTPDTDTGDVNGDGVTNAADLTANDGNSATYDDELLNAHFITGDGRGNENIALTTVHAIFHAEHNRLVDSNKSTILATGDVAFLNQWLLVDQAATLTAAQVQALDPASLTWDGERLFQAARFANEMQYQHMVFEEFARRIQPMIDPFVFNTSPDVDPSVLAEFAHTVYRFGHSMLTGTVDRLENDLTAVNEGLNNNPDQKTLLAVFLNPGAYLDSGTDLATINANIIRGLSRDVGNEIDEFIVNNLRTNLLGLPLDLAVLNLARGRDTGIPSLNDTRAQLYHDTGLTDLKPYTSWADFAEYLKNPMSIINFIAAYGTHTAITSATTLAGKRAAAEEIVFGVEADGTTLSDIGDRLAFLNATGPYAGGTLGGLNDVDLWIGGLAEAKPEFGGMLGTTFNYVFEYQMENLQNGDRFYYLTRTQGTNFLNQLEPNTFADMIMRNTALGDVHATHLSGQLFVTPDLFLEQDVGIAQTDYNGAVNDGTRVSEDPTWADDELHPLTTPLKVTREGGAVVDGHTVGGLFKFYGPEHVVMGGTEGDDRIYSDKGDDTLWGDAGNDYLNGGTAADDVFGGDGDDVIEDPFGDDILRGERGNDVISDSRGANILFGGEGQDYILVGQDATEVFAGSETDFVLGGNGKDFLMGNEGDDWIEGGGGFDTLVGENSELFFNSPIIGHDVLFGHGDETDYDAESGDDIMGSGPSVYRYEGMHGFDWGIAKFDTSNIHFDMQIPIFTNNEENVLRDRFDQVEGASGWVNDDKLDGDDRGHSGGSSSPDSTPVEMFTDHTLTLEGINRIAGLQQLLGGTSITSFKNGNILLGGDGNDTIRGRGGFDTIDGDAWLNVRIKIVHGGVTYSAESMTTDTVVAGPNAGKVFNVYTAADQAANPLNIAGSPNFSSVAFGGRSLNSLLLDRTINPGEMSIVREILYDNTNVTGAAKNIDTALFQGGDLEYEIEGTRIIYDTTTGEALRRVNDTGDETAALNIRDVNGDGFIRVKDLDDGLQAAPGRVGGLTVSRGALTDDVDLLKNMERLQFADKAYNIGGTTNSIATGTVTISDPTPYDFDNNPATPSVVSPIVGQVLTATLSNLADLDGIPIDPATGMPVGLTFDWETTEAGNDGGWAKITSGLTYTVRPVDPAHVLRAVAVFKDSAGVTERIASIQTDNVTAPFSVLENTPTGTVIAPVPFSLDYDPLGFGGTGVTDGDVVQLTHMIQPGQDAGGRFTIVNTGTAAAPVYQLVVANGALLDYEAVQTPADNEYQIVIDTYTDTIANGGTLMASRQFTILLNNSKVEDIKWNPPAVGASATPSDTALPGVGAVVGTLTTASDTATTFNYSVVSQTSPGGGGFTVNPTTGVVTRTGSAMATNTTYTIVVMSTPANGDPARTETFTIKTGSSAASLGGPGSSALGSNGDDILFTLQGNDTAFGLAGNDILYGQEGNDRLDGGEGADYMAGGAGDDTYVVDNAGDVVNERTGAGGASAGGNDTVETTLSNYTLTQSVQNLVFTGTGNFTGTGRDDEANAITGGAGNDVLSGLNGDDTLTGLAGGDTLNGGGGVDTAVYTTSNAAVSINLALDTASGGHAQGDNLNDIENLTGSGFNDTLIGNALANDLQGGDGDDVLVGGAGADHLDGQVGTDTADYRGSNVAVTINRQLDTASGGHAQGDTLDGIENVIGSAFNDALTGNAAANQLFGGAGNDTIEGGDGVDLVDGGTDNDTLSGGTGDDADTIIGGAGHDTINLLATGGGNDTIVYNAIGFGNDVLTNFDADGGTAATQDLIDLRGLGITAATLANRVFESTVGGTNTLLTIRENGAASAIQGTIQINGVTNAAIDASDYILATATAPTPGATNGADTLTGTNGNDTIIGLLGADTINAQGGDDTIIWNAGGGGAGDGRDIVNGGVEGTAGDTFVVNGNSSAETYTIYTRAAALAQVPAGVLGTLNAATEIVIRRQTGSGTDVVVAELSEIEEIRINGVDPADATGSAGGAGPDVFNIVGDFTGTSLRLNTITIDGQAGDDTVDISSLGSAHRIVFRSNGGNDTIVGTLRSQDVIELPGGAIASDYTSTTTNGVTTLTNGTHSITYTASGAGPQIGDEENPIPDEDEDGPDLPGVGTDDRDTLIGTAESDYLIGFNGDDVIIGQGGADVILGGGGSDFLSGFAGTDSVYGDAGDDTIMGGDDADMIDAGDGADRVFADSGNDYIVGGLGNDVVVGGAGDDRIVAGVSDGNDSYFGDEMNAGGVGKDTLDMSMLSANATVDLGSGLQGIGSASSSQSGTDMLWGIDNVVTGSGNDTITASDAANLMDGGTGDDTFVFKSVAAANGDTIIGFETGDKLDLSAIDADTGAFGNQAFTVTTSAIDSARDLMVSYETRADGDYTVVSGNVDGTNASEFKISIKGTHDLTSSDFNL